MDGHAAHRDRLAQVRAALGERDVEAGRSGPWVGQEKLEEIAHPEKQQGVARLILEAPVLGHHRGWSVGAGHVPNRSRWTSANRPGIGTRVTLARPLR